MKKPWECLPGIVGLTLVSTPAWAEVADKEPSVLQMWMLPIVISLIALGLGLKRPIFALLLLPISIFCAWGGIEEFNDPWVGPKIQEELGDQYIQQGYFTFAITVLAPIVIWIVLARLRKQR